MITRAQWLQESSGEFVNELALEGEEPIPYNNCSTGSAPSRANCSAL